MRDMLILHLQQCAGRVRFALAAFTKARNIIDHLLILQEYIQLNGTLSSIYEYASTLGNINAAGSGITRALPEVPDP